jgi:uncharacterized protein YhdP
VKRFRVIALWVLGVLAVLLVVGWVGLKVYVSGPAREAVSAQLSESLGLPVEVESLDVGVGSSSAAIRILDPGADPPDNLVRIGSIDTDLSLGGLAAGQTTPTRLAAKDVDILLRIDDKGQILSPLPTPADGGGKAFTLPTVTLSQTRIRIRQTGHPEFVLGGVSGELKRDGDGYTISGQVDDPQWGKWTIRGRLADDPADGSIELSTDKGVLKDSQLRTIPYVPQAVWDHLQASGETPASVSFTWKPGTPFGYAVVLKPEAAASVTFPDADVTLDKVKGDIRIADGKVTVKGGRVAVADGTADVGVAYTFDQPTAVIEVKVAAEGMDLRKLPAAWGLPKEIEGRLHGNADLQMRLPPGGKLETSGSGSGVVKGAKLAGLDAEITLRLVAKDGRYQFDKMSSD